MNATGPTRVGTLATYRQLLEEVDSWFWTCQQTHPQQITCRKGCSGCCRGLFDISLLDAALLQQGFRTLTVTTQRDVEARCRRRVETLQHLWPGFTPPWLLNTFPADTWQQMPEDDDTPCPLLSDAGVCLVYAHRPLICRLHGLPNIDTSGEDFSAAICTRNFVNSDPFAHLDLRWNFRETFHAEIALLEAFTTALTGVALREVDTFIPCAPLIDFEGTDWESIARRYRAE